MWSAGLRPGSSARRHRNAPGRRPALRRGQRARRFRRGRTDFYARNARFGCHATLSLAESNHSTAGRCASSVEDNNSAVEQIVSPDEYASISTERVVAPAEAPLCAAELVSRSVEDQFLPAARLVVTAD
jgi:hypothetical protein